MYSIQGHVYIASIRYLYFQLKEEGIIDNLGRKWFRKNSGGTCKRQEDSQKKIRLETVSFLIAILVAGLLIGFIILVIENVVPRHYLNRFLQ